MRGVLRLLGLYIRGHFDLSSIKLRVKNEVRRTGQAMYNLASVISLRTNSD